MSMILDEHRQYLSDEVRVGLYRKAISKVIKPGDVVVDLGCGTGIFGLMACQAGAARVYAIEAGSIIDLARDIAEANGFADRIVHVHGLSGRISLPERADVMVADQAGHFGFEAGLLKYFRDGAKRLLKSGGTAIPSRLEQWIAPVSYPEAYRNVEFWNSRPIGLNFVPAGIVAHNTGYPADFFKARFLGRPVRLSSIDTLDPPRTLKASISLSITSPGLLHGFCGYFTAQLAPGIVMTNSPFVRSPINRRRVFFPVQQAVRVVPGDKMTVAMNIRFDETLVFWRVQVLGRDGTLKLNSNNSTMQGMMMALADLRKIRPDFAPALTPWGTARKTVINLFDGVRTLAQIEREVFNRHRELFPSAADAALFVAEVVVPYGDDAKPESSASRS